MAKYKNFLSISLAALTLVACQPASGTRQAAQTPDTPATPANLAEDSIAQTSTPVTTQYYSLALPEDWSVLYGPVKERGTVRFQLIDKAKTSTVSITVGPSQAGDAKRMAERIATRLQTKAVQQNQQWQCTFKNDKGAGYTIVREDAANALLMVLTVSGDISKANFVYQMRGPYPALLPTKF